MIGDTQGWLGQSVYLRDICGREEGAPPPVDLAAEKRNGDVVRGMIHAGTATAVHDVSDGGLLIALAEMAIASGIGAQLLAAPGSIVPHAYWFGEDQARYIVTVPAADAGLVLAKMKGAGVPCARIGTTGGDAIAVAGETPVAVNALNIGVRALAAGLYERQGVGSCSPDGAKRQIRGISHDSGPGLRFAPPGLRTFTAPSSRPGSAATPASAPN